MTNHQASDHTELKRHSPVELGPRRARAGRRDVPILYVLVFSTILAVVLLLAVWLGFYVAHV